MEETAREIHSSHNDTMTTWIQTKLKNMFVFMACCILIAATKCNCMEESQGVHPLVSDLGGARNNAVNVLARARGRHGGVTLQGQLLGSPQHQQQEHNQQPQRPRQLVEMRSGDVCHEYVLRSGDGDDFNLTTAAQGLVFSIENNSTQDVDITALSVYLDQETRLSFDFDVYQMDGAYLAREDNGSIIDTTLGGTLDGSGNWTLVAHGKDVKLRNFTLDEDGGSFLPFSSFGGIVGSVTTASGGVKSFYMKFSANVLAVHSPENWVVEGETHDVSATVTESYSGLKINVGRTESLWLHPDEFGLDFYEVFYSPARFVGKLWTELNPCSPTASPITGQPSATPTDLPTTRLLTKSPSVSPTANPSFIPTNLPTKQIKETVAGNSVVTNFGSGGRRMLRSSIFVRTLQDTCLSQAELNFFQEKLEEHCQDVYDSILGNTAILGNTISITDHIDVSSNPGDCEKIKFVYTQSMEFNVGANDETTVAEIIQLPLAKAANRGAFVQYLIDESSNDSSAAIMSKFGSLEGVEEIVVTADGLSTRSPTGAPSSSMLPTGFPSSSPHGSPSGSPSKSLVPSISSFPTAPPSDVPSTSFSPTATSRPSESPSITPTLSSKPTSDPSAQPSIQPSVSQAPSSAPSTLPSFLPSLSPSQSPSLQPSSLLNYVGVEYSFDARYYESDGDQIKSAIQGNVTQMFQGLFDDPDSLLYDLSVTYGLGFSTRDGDQDYVREDFEPADAADCGEIDGSGDPDSACHRLVLGIFFEHKRTLSEGVAIGWLLEVSDTIADDLSEFLDLSYTGDESVRTTQIMVLHDIEEEPKDFDAVCNVIQEILSNSSYLANYTIMDVDCKRFEVIPPPKQGRILPFKTRDRGMLRQLRVVGDLEVWFEVTGRYNTARRAGENEDLVDADFSGLMEQSINADTGRIIGRTLDERGVLALTGKIEVTSETKETPPPTSAPFDEVYLIDPPPDPLSVEPNFLSEPTGIAVIATSATVVVLVAGFLFYKGMQSPKVDEKTLSSDPDDFSSGNVMPGRHLFSDELERYPDVPGQGDTPGVVLPTHYNRTVINTFGSAVGSSRPPNSNTFEDERLGNTTSGNRSDVDQSNVNLTLQENNDGELQLTSSRDRLAALEVSNLSNRGNARTVRESQSPRKVANEDKYKDSPTSASSTFEERLRKKANKGSFLHRQRSSSWEAAPMRLTEDTMLAERNEKRGRSASPQQSHHNSKSSLASLEKWEERIEKKSSQAGRGRREQDNSTVHQSRLDTLFQRKLEKSKGRQRSRSPSSNSAKSFEDRLRAKLSKNGNANEVRIGGSQGNSSSSTFEDRLRRKANKGSLLHKQRSSSLGDMLRKLDKEQLLEDQNDKRSRSVSSHPDRQHNESLSSLSALEKWEEKIKKKSSHAEYGISQQDNSTVNQSRLDARLQKKLEDSNDTQRSLSPASHSAKSFEDRVREKLSKQNGNANEVHSAGTQGNSPPSSFEERLRRKANKGSLLHRQRSSSLEDARRKLDDFDTRMGQMLEEQNTKRSRSVSPHPIRHHDKSGSPLSALEKWEERIKNKNSQAGQVDQSRFDALLQKKVEESNDMHRSRSPSSYSAFKKNGNANEVFNADTQGNSSSSTFEERLRRKANKGSLLHRQRSSSLEDMRRKLDDFDTRMRQMPEEQNTKPSRSVSPHPVRHHDESGSSLSALEKWEERVRNKNSQVGKVSREQDNSTTAVQRRTSSRLDNFDARLQKKMDGAQSSKGSASQSAEIFDARGQMKLSGDNINANRGQSGGAQGASSFVERARRKAHNGSHLNRQRSSSLGSTHQRKLDDFDARLQRKLEEKKGSRNDRDGSPLHFGHSKAGDSLSTVQIREERTEKTNSPLTQNNIRYKKSEVNKDHSRAPQESSPSFDERMKRKTSRGYLNRQRSSSLGAAEKTAQRNLDDFDARLQRKLKVKKGRQHRGSPPHANYSDHDDSLSTLEKLEERIRKKSSETSNGSSDYKNSKFSKGPRSMPQESAPVINERLKRKAKVANLDRQRSSSLGAVEKTAQRNLDDDNKKGRQHSGPPKHADHTKPKYSLPTLDILEERIRAKSSQAGNISSGYGKSERRDEHSGVSSSLENVINRNISRGGLNRQRSSSMSATENTPQRKMDDFDARLQRKLKEKERRRTTKASQVRRNRRRSSSLGDPPSASARHLDTFEARIQQKLEERKNKDISAAKS